MASPPAQPFIPPHRRVAAVKKEQSQCQIAPKSLPVIPDIQNTSAIPQQYGGHVALPEEPLTKSAFPTRAKNKKWNKSARRAAQYNNRQSKDGEIDLSTSWHVPPVPVLDTTQGCSIINDNGSWVIPLEEWDPQEALLIKHSPERVQAWLDDIVSDPDPLQFTIRDLPSTNFHQAIPSHVSPPKCYYFSSPPSSQDVMGAIVPLSWRPDLMEESPSLCNFWDSIQTAGTRPYDPDDLIDVKPWWERSLAPIACFELPYEHPSHNGIDLNDESPEQRRRRLADKGSEGAIISWRAGKPGRGRGRDRGRGGRGRGGRAASPHLTTLVEQATDTEPSPWVTNIQQEVVVLEEPPIDTSIHPKVNLYLRGAEISDMAQITQIYNHYATKTVHAPECKAVLPSHMLDRLRDIDSVSHVFMVACLAGGPSSRAVGKKKRSHHITSTDRIIGFAYSDDFSSPHGMYRFLAEVQVYTDPEFTQKGVATCLMDKLTAILDPHFIPRGGYEIRDDELGLGSIRLVNCLWINFPYVPEGGEKEWASKWLQSMGFEQTGDHKKVAFKIGQRANLAVFTRFTGCDIDPLKPPNHDG